MRDIHKLKSAWVITWVGTSGVPVDPLVSVIDYRRSAAKVCDLVEQLYIALSHEPRVKLLFAKRARDNPFRAKEYPFERILCGSNPWLYARRVTNLCWKNNELVWSEPRPSDELRKELADAGYFRE